MKPRPTVAVVGASRDRSKYGNISVRAHQRAGYDVYPVNPHAREIEGLTAYRDLASVPVAMLDRIAVYLPPDVGRRMLPEIAAKGAVEVWFNPGSADEAACNPTYGQAIARTLPTSVRFALKLGF